MQSQVRNLTAEAIVEIAQGADSIPSFRLEILQLAQRTCGFDFGVFQDMSPTAVIDPRLLFDFPAEWLEVIRSNWNRYQTELTDMLLEMQRGAISGLSRRYSPAVRKRLGLYRDVHQPNGIQHDLQSVLLFRKDVAASLSVARHCTTPFPQPAVDALQRVLPTIALAEAALRYRSQAGTSDAVAIALTPNERELVQFAALGFTNIEIAHALGISPFTVRNRLIHLYRKLSVSSRAELVGRLSSTLAAGANAPSPPPGRSGTIVRGGNLNEKNRCGDRLSDRMRGGRGKPTTGGRTE